MNYDEFVPLVKDKEWLAYAIELEEENFGDVWEVDLREVILRIDTYLKSIVSITFSPFDSLLLDDESNFFGMEVQGLYVNVGTSYQIIFHMDRKGKKQYERQHLFTHQHDENVICEGEDFPPAKNVKELIEEVLRDFEGAQLDVVVKGKRSMVNVPTAWPTIVRQYEIYEFPPNFNQQSLQFSGRR